ncbi:hypothetical protein E1B28_004018 [Marasmius oreades]|uniref:Uncharacterized protein n=1 Tax=Marasmius oreades TaxID=181124 RepID=A0A9P8ACQ5_9AGAR|nr:uncharacterized protein E1B28_004018 [Marasmius oreades]KAG7096600.1 hypothetical protein E1B28_004018 [Marasmius oreades]
MSNSASLDNAKTIQALLVQLGQSQAWKEAQNEQLQGSTLIPENEAASASANTSVASLLSQLQTQTGDQTTLYHHSNTEASLQEQPRYPNPIPIPDSHAIHAPKLRSGSLNIDSDLDGANYNRSSDLRHYSFLQSLPILAELANRRECVDQLIVMKKQQDTLERQLLEERISIKKKHEQKVKDALFKARLVGSGLSPHEARMLNDGYRDELKKFDGERAISAWEDLVAEQQESLSSLGIPAMFLTHVGSEREAQRKVVHVLEGLIGNAP